MKTAVGPDQLIARFLPGATAEPLRADASVRSFYRLRRGTTTLVAMVDAGGGAQQLDRLLAAHEVLSRAGARVPRLHDRAEDLDALAMEDLGDQLLADALARCPPAEQERLYRAAGAMAGRIACADPAAIDAHAQLGQPRLAWDRLRAELSFFLVHEVVARRGCADRPLLAELGRSLDRVADAAAALPPRLAHRDFHARNLMVLPDGTLAVVDFQDALLAPRHYDLASLVRDPYVVPAAELEQAARVGYAEQAPAIGPPNPTELAWVALQRDLKAIGTYAYQARLGGRPQFAGAIAPAERLALRAVDELPPADAAPLRDVLARIGFSST
jgi:hypothetical protein